MFQVRGTPMTKSKMAGNVRAVVRTHMLERGVGEMRISSRARTGLVAGLLAVAAAAGFAADSPEESAQKAADSWLKQVDDGKYGESWDAASALFKAAVTREQWAQAAGAVRSSVGKLGSRKLKSREFTRALPGAPEGQYVTLQYDSTFEKKPSAVETFVATQDTDGSWRAAGYFVK
jgi:Protein of unknown function (DUF4019)